jgi:hypothetical protein
VKSLTGGRGAAEVLDFVGGDVTGNLVVAYCGMGSTVMVIGAGRGGDKLGLTSSLYNMTVSTSLWGRRKFLGLVEMARRGQVGIRTTTYPIEARRACLAAVLSRRGSAQSLDTRAPLRPVCSGAGCVACATMAA